MYIKKLYYYFFYKIYKAIIYTSAPFGNYLINFKAGLVLVVLQIWSYISIINYYTALTGDSFKLSIISPIIYIPLIVILGFNYYTLDYLNNWKEYNREFDQLSKKKNRMGSLFATVLVLILTVNFIFSFYCLFQKAKQDHTGPYAPELVAKERIEDSLQRVQQIEKLRKIYGTDNK